MGTILQDFSYAQRMLRKRPGLTVVAVLTLALGIGANIAIFSVADGLLWKPLPVPDQDRLVSVMDGRLPGRESRIPTSPATYLDWKESNTVFEGLSAYQQVSVNVSSQSGAAVSGGSEPERVKSFRVSADFFDTLRAKPSPGLGRTFLAEEEQTGRENVVVLSHGLWQRRFGGDRGLVGGMVTLDGQSYTVIGVMKPEFDFPLGAELWMPMAWSAQRRSARTSHDISTVARLKEGASVARAQTEMTGVARRLEQEHPDTNERWGVITEPLVRYLLGDTPRYVWLLLGAVGFVLLIACVNVANLQLARATTRVREIAVRRSLGASRWRVMRQLLTESLLFSVLGAILALLVAAWGIDAIRLFFPADLARGIPGWNAIHLDARAFGFAIAVALASGVLAGLAPAFHSSRVGVGDALKEAGRTTAGSREGRVLRGLFVSLEMALAMILLVGAGMMAHGFLRLLQEERHPHPEGLLTMRLSLPIPKYSKRADVTAFYDQVLVRVSALPGVESAAFSTSVPHTWRGNIIPFVVEGKPARSGEDQLCFYNSVSPAYFRTVREPLLDGRFFGAQDGPDAPPVAIVDDQMARRYWPGEKAVGKRIRIGLNPANPWVTVVAVVEDREPSRYAQRPPLPIVYAPYTQAPDRSMMLAIRGAIKPRALVAPVSGEIRSVDREQPVYDVKTMRQLIDDQWSGTRLIQSLVGLFGALALTLSAVGVAGVTAYTVTERTHEIGVRVALGANSGDVLRLIVWQAMRPAVIGMAAGAAGAFALARLFSGLFYAVSPVDPFAFAIVAALLGVVAMAACYWPARRATRVDPAMALRYE